MKVDRWSTRHDFGYYCIEYLEPRRSSYRQHFLKGRRVRAAVVYQAVHGPDP
jgi:hypothetical protein